MRKLAPVLLRALNGPIPLRGQTRTPDKKKAIRNIERQWEAARNHHDAHALAQLAAADADFINVRGAWGKGREQFGKNQTAQHQTAERTSVWKTTEVDVRFPTPDVAIVHVCWTLSGERAPDGSTPRSHLGTIRCTVKKSDGPWFIAASQATNVMPEPSAGSL
jgi:uncharacterized protein (TIGR02246 family)